MTGERFTPLNAPDPPRPHSEGYGLTYAYLGPTRQVSSLALPNGAAIVNGFDSLGRPLSTTLQNSSSALLNQHSYLYDDVHRRTRQTRKTLGAASPLSNYVDYAYDAIDQLAGAVASEVNGAATTPRRNESLSYQYDASGNLSQRVNDLLTENFVNNTRDFQTSATASGTVTVSGMTAEP